ncbi:MAG: hypothetical protein KJ058_14195 [Thermoanaerobaculia bacterium]|nr:hypothetical protein [Thermoanaerobaculia bacterium]
MRVPAALLGLSLLAAAPPAPESPAPGERWLFNAGERTRTGLAAWGEGADPEASRGPFEQALRLAPAAAETRFNAGTSRLAAGAEGAEPLLAGAARDATPELAPRAWYNLGNARLGAGDAAGAVAAYVESLRRDPASPDAKHNLELALRALERQRSEQQGDTGQSPRGEPQEREQQGGSTPPGEQESPPEPPAGGSANQEFQQQPDMTRDQAQALLEAVESLEREQRRRAAEERAAARAKVEIDW